jgi:hypothetical protein
MTAYTGIQGQNILIVSSDPSDPTEGQIWYNSTSNLLKGYANVVTNAWASGGNLPAPVAGQGYGAAGIQTAALQIGGETPSSSSNNSYNGTAWTSIPSLNTGRTSLNGNHIGTQTAALLAGGYLALTNTESWDGSSWTNAPTLNTGRRLGGATGIQTSALFYGGSSPPASAPTASESFNGTSWTSTPSLNTARGQVAGAGDSNTSALAFGGNPPASGEALVSTESYNGSSWTSVNSLNTKRSGAGGAGTQTSALIFGGNIGSPTFGTTGATELWNGTSWTNNPTGLSGAAQELGGTGTQASALRIGGGSPNVQTEEWTGSSIQVRTITTS